MKALTIWQPYAEQICRGDKTVENRRWNTNYRGDMRVHASANTLRGPVNLPRGVMVCVVDLLDVHRVDHGEACRCETDEQGAEFEVGVWHWILRRPRRLPLVPARGMPALWRVDTA